MIKKSRIAILCNILSIFFLISGCVDTGADKIEFVKNGSPQFLSLSEDCEQKENYLQPGNNFLIKADQVIYGDDIEVKMGLSIDKSNAHINIIIGDNTFCITNEYGNKDEKGVFLWGPSINKTIDLGKISQYIKMNSQFELTVSYINDILTYTINEEKIFADKPAIKPAGMMVCKDSLLFIVKIFGFN